MSTSPFKIGIVGCAGRMGRMLVSEVLATAECTLAGGTEPVGPLVGTDIGLLVGEHPHRDDTRPLADLVLESQRFADRQAGRALGESLAVGVDDPHLKRDRYDTVAGTPNPVAQLKLGLTHSPEPRVLDRFADDGYDLVLADISRPRMDAVASTLWCSGL